MLFDFFAKNLVAPESTRIVHDKYSGLGRGIGFATFKDIATVPLALNLTGTKLKNREIRISKIAKKKDVGLLFMLLMASK